MSPSSPFFRLWRSDRSRETFLSCVPKDDLACLRLVCRAINLCVAPTLFKTVAITFRSSIFTKPVRIAALNRIGHHVRTVKFTITHGPETFLAPLVDPITGHEIPFIYEPYTHSGRSPATRFSSPCYGSWELNDLLVKQYPPLFHAAANVPSFIRAFSAMPNVKHLQVSCPGQKASERYRRSIVDYALISLRIAIEKSKLPKLGSLILLPIHPGAVLYLSPTMGFGAGPSSIRRWKQIRKLTIHMDTITTGPLADHLKLLHSYLQTFTSSLTDFKFYWHGPDGTEGKGPCPLSFVTEDCLQRNSPHLACPKTCHLALRPLRFERLRDVEFNNISVDASQISSFITEHRHTLCEVDLRDIHFRSGTWDEALSALTRISGSEKWKERTEEEEKEEAMDVPLMLSPEDFEQERLNRVWADYMRARSSKPLHEVFHRASAKGKELLFGTEEHMRNFIKTSVFSWR